MECFCSPSDQGRVPQQSKRNSPTVKAEQPDTRSRQPGSSLSPEHGPAGPPCWGCQLNYQRNIDTQPRAGFRKGCKCHLPEGRSTLDRRVSAQGVLGHQSGPQATASRRESPSFLQPRAEGPLCARLKPQQVYGSASKERKHSGQCLCVQGTR